MTTQNPIRSTATNPNHSSGPTSAAGKETSSKNATKHGCCALDTLILPTENIADFQALAQSYSDAYHVQPGFEENLLSHAVESEWFHIRATRAYARVEADIYSAAPNPCDWTEQMHKDLARFLRYKTRHANDSAKFLKQLEAYRKISRADEASKVKKSKTTQKQEEQVSKQEKSEKLAMLELLSQHGLARWEDTEGVFD